MNETLIRTLIKTINWDEVPTEKISQILGILIEVEKPRPTGPTPKKSTTDLEDFLKKITRDKESEPTPKSPFPNDPWQPTWDPTNPVSPGSPVYCLADLLNQHSSIGDVLRDPRFQILVEEAHARNFKHL